MSKNIFIVIKLFTILLINIACVSKYTALSENSDPTLTPTNYSSTLTPVSLNISSPSPIFTASVTPTLISTSTPKPTRTPTLTVAPTVISITPVPDIKILPTPIPHNISIAFSELEMIKFITVDMIAYLHWGSVYTYSLSTRSGGLLIGEGDISSFDWSASQQQFAVTQNDHLLLLSPDGSLSRSLSVELPPIHPDLKSLQDCDWTEMKETDNLLDYVKWVIWNPEYPYLVFGAANVDIPHHLCGPKAWSVNIQTNTINQIGSSGGHLYDPKQKWLNSDSLLLGYYTGGGSWFYDIVSIQDGTIPLTFGTYSSIPIASANGHRLANISEKFFRFTVWDIVAGNEIWKNKYDQETLLDKNAWSSDGRYLALSQTETLINSSSKNIMSSSVLVLDVDTHQKWQPDYQFSDRVFPIWAPNIDELFIFNPQVNDTNIFLANPTNRMLKLLNVVPEKHLNPVCWSTTSRYLILTERQQTRSFWLWDNQKADDPLSLVYELNIPNKIGLFRDFVWSPDDEWILFTERVGESISDAQYTDMTLKTLHLPTGQQHEIATWEIIPPQ